MLSTQNYKHIVNTPNLNYMESSSNLSMESSSNFSACGPYINNRGAQTYATDWREQHLSQRFTDEARARGNRRGIGGYS